MVPMQKALVVSLLVHAAVLAGARPIAAHLALWTRPPPAAEEPDRWAGTSIEVSTGVEGLSPGDTTAPGVRPNAAAADPNPAAPPSPPSSPPKNTPSPDEPPSAPPAPSAPSAAPTAPSAPSTTPAPSAAPSPSTAPAPSAAPSPADPGAHRPRPARPPRKPGGHRPHRKPSAPAAAPSSAPAAASAAASAAPADSASAHAAASPAPPASPGDSASPAGSASPAASSSAIAAGGDKAGGGGSGTFGAAGQASVRDLGRAFTRAIPAACQADPAWSKVPVGDAGTLRAELHVDAEGHLTGAEPQGESPPKHLVNILRRTVPLLMAGTFAVRGGAVTAGTQILEIKAVVSDEAGSDDDGARDRLSFSYEGGRGKASFTQTGGRRVDVSVRVVSVKTAD